MAKKKAIKLATATAVAASAFVAAAPAQTEAAVNVKSVVDKAVKKMVSAQNSFVAKATDKKLVDVKTVQANQAAAVKEYNSAKATVKKYGGKSTKAYNAKLDAAKKTMDYRIKMYVDARKEVSQLAVVNQATKKVTDIAKLEEQVKVLEAQIAKTEKLIAKVIGASTRDKMTAMAVTPSKKTLAAAKAKIDEEKAIVKVESVSAINKTKVEVTFSKAVDSVKAENFTIAGASVSSATLSEDKKKATLEVSGLDYDKKYTVDVKGVLVNGTATDLGSKEFKSLAVSDLWNLVISPKASSLKADGADNTEVTFQLIDKATGKVDTNADNMVLDLNTTYGTLASKRVTIQDGQATVLLTSEFSNTNITAKIDAQIIEASGDYKALIGKVVATSYVSFVTSDANNVETITMVSAEANQADRVTLFFDKNVSLKHFVDTDPATGELYYQKVDGNGNVVASNLTANAPELVGVDGKYIRHQLNTVASGAKSVKLSQGTNTNFVVKGFKPVAGNPKAIEVILEKGTVLKDNASVDVEVNTVNSLQKETKSSTEFKVTDARKPEATSVTPEGLNTLKVKFSEAIKDADFTIDGRFGTKDTHFKATVGDFNAVTLVDNRDLATIELLSGYDEDGGANPSTTKAGFFTAGNHTLQVSSTKDFAFATDVNNMGTTQNLNFAIAADTAQPTATVTVESPEQFRVKFNKALSETEAQVKAALKFEYYDATSNTWKPVAGDTTKFSNNVKATTADLLEVKQVGSTSEYVVELTQDWTTIYNTAGTAKNYYNDKFRLVFDEKKVTNAANGEQNAKIELDLNASGSALNTPDVTSASISSIDRRTATNVFDVTMSEPVKLVGNTDGSKDNAGATLAQGQGSSLPTTTVQFIGTDKDGKIVTFDGTVNNYSDSDNGDKKFDITWNPINGATPQTVVDAGGKEDWTLVVRSLSDDVGNTVASATKQFKIAKSAATVTPFFVEKTMVKGDLADSTKDVVTVTFSEGVQISGTGAATNTANYTLNGQTLPAGTSIKVLNDDDNASYPSAAGFEKVEITLPDNTLLKGANVSNVITVNKNLVSYDGSVLERGNEFVIDVAANNQADADLAVAQPVIDKINALPAVASITLATKPTVVAARTAYTGLTPAQQAFVTNLTKLTAAEAKIADLEAVDAAKTALITLAFDATNGKDHATAPIIVKPANHANGSTYTFAVSAVTGTGLKALVNSTTGNVDITRGTVAGSFKITVTITKGSTTDTKVFDVAVPEAGASTLDVTVTPAS